MEKPAPRAFSIYTLLCLLHAALSGGAAVVVVRTIHANPWVNAAYHTMPIWYAWPLWLLILPIIGTTRREKFGLALFVSLVLWSPAGLYLLLIVTMSGHC